MAVSHYVQAGLAWADLRAVFVTHLHADHVAERFQIFLLGRLPHRATRSPGRYRFTALVPLAAFR